MTLRVDRRARGLTLVVEDGQPIPTPTRPRDGDGISQQPDGSFRVRVSVGTRAHTLTRHKRFPPGTPRRLMRDWRAGALSRLLDVLPARTVGGTLAADVAAYVAALPPSSRTYAQDCLAWWVDAWGPRQTLSLTAQDIARQLAEFRRQGAAASSCNKYRSKLSVLFRWRYPDEPNPVTPTARFPSTKGSAPTLTLDAVRAMIDTIEASPSKRVLKVFAETGMPYTRIRQVRPDHLRLDGPDPTVYLLPRHKGAGTRGRWFPLTQAGVAAWRDLAAHAYEVPGNERMYRAWHGACRRAGLPEVKPYVLRHVIASELLRRCNGNVFAVAEMLDVSLATAQHYARGGVADAVRSLVDAMDGVSGRGSGHSDDSGQP
jgi:integrase